MFKAISPLIGMQRAGLIGLPDATQRHPSGTLIFAVDEFLGGAELLYVQASGAIRMGGLVAVTPVLVSGILVHQAAEVPNTANLGKSIFVAMTPMTANQWGWVAVSGCVPVNCTASVAADTGLGIVAAGQGGAIAAGKQILGMRSTLAATTTNVKFGVANAGSFVLSVSGPNGWFIGAYLSGTGIAAATVVTDIDPSGTQVTLSVATTAAVNGNVTATYNNGTIFYNVVHMNTPIAQGQIT